MTETDRATEAQSQAGPEPAAAGAAEEQGPRQSRSESAQPQPDSQRAELRQRLDQVGAILAKGLDLAEAGVSLGVTIINRAGIAAQQKIRDRMDAATTEAADSAAGRQPGQRQDVPPPVAPMSEPEPAYGLTNRLPLSPGGNFSISFSVNNDSLTEPKKVELQIKGFIGESNAAQLDVSDFKIKPNQKTIAPVDFEKFVLQGSIPADTPCDTFRGSVDVLSDMDLNIPVVLVVMPP